VNRYEVLEAPTSLKPKDLAVHIRMKPGIPKEVSGPARTALINAKVRLFEELTTCRYGRTLPGEEPPEYRKVCRAVSGSDAEPIPGRFFAGELAALLEEVPTAATMSKAQLEKRITALPDHWRVQAWAALILRIAQAAEVSDPAKAASVWARALRYYKGFFKRAKLEESYTFINDPDGRPAAAEAWDSFLGDLVGGLKERMDAYARRQDGRAVSACSQVLRSEAVAAIAPEIAQTAQASVLTSFVDGIGAASPVGAATKLYRQVPVAVRRTDERGELVRALIGAMTKETELVSKGFGNPDAVLVAYRQVESMGGYEGARPVVRAALGDFFDACAAAARAALGDDASPDAKTAAVALLDVVPEDWEIGRGSASGEKITKVRVISMLLSAELAPRLQGLLDALMEAPAATQGESDALGELVAFAKREKSFMAGPAESEIIENVLLKIFRSTAGQLLEDFSKLALCRHQLITIRDFLGRDTETEFGGAELSLADHCIRAESVSAFKTANEAPLGSGLERDAIRELLRNLADRGSDGTWNFEFGGGRFGDVVRDTLMKLAMVHRESENGSATLASEILDGLGLEIASGPRGSVRIIPREAPAEKAMAGGQAAESLDLSGQLNRHIKKLMYAPAATQAESDALNELIAFAQREKSFATGPEESAAIEKALLKIFESTASELLEDFSKEDLCVSQLKAIEDFLDFSKRIDLGGVELRLFAHARRVRYLSALRAANEAPLGSSLERAAVRSLCIGREFWADTDDVWDFRINGEQFDDLVRQTLMKLAAVHQSSPRGSKALAKEILKDMKKGDRTVAHLPSRGTSRGVGVIAAAVAACLVLAGTVAWGIWVWQMRVHGEPFGLLYWAVSAAAVAANVAVLAWNRRIRS
jgi:hypothetical protein